MLKEINIALYVYYKHLIGNYTISDNICPVCNVQTFWEKMKVSVH